MGLMKDCKKGDDTVCKSSYGQDACCMMVQCVDAPESPNSIQSIQQAGYVALGYPVKKGDSIHMCNMSVELLRATQDTGTDGIVTDKSNGFTIRSYCDGAKMLAGVFTSAASVIMASNY